MNRLAIVCVLVTFATVGCTGRHVVIDPDEASGLDSAEWTIAEEPSHEPAQPESKKKEQQEEESTP